MKEITSFLGAFCCCSVALGAVYLLVPSGKMSKTVRAAFCICLLSALILPFTAIKKVSSGFSGNTEKAEIADLAVTEAVFKRALTNAKIEFKDLNVLTSKNADGGIDIIEVTVISDAPKEKIADVIGNDEYYKVSVVGE